MKQSRGLKPTEQGAPPKGALHIGVVSNSQQRRINVSARFGFLAGIIAALLVVIGMMIVFG